MGYYGRFNNTTSTTTPAQPVASTSVAKPTVTASPFRTYKQAKPLSFGEKAKSVAGNVLGKAGDILNAPGKIARKALFGEEDMSTFFKKMNIGGENFQKYGGLVGDFILDPLNFIPIGAIVGNLGKAAGKVSKAKTLISGLDKGYDIKNAAKIFDTGSDVGRTVSKLPVPKPQLKVPLPTQAKGVGKAIASDAEWADEVVSGTARGEIKTAQAAEDSWSNLIKRGQYPKTLPTPPKPPSGYKTSATGLKAIAELGKRMLVPTKTVLARNPVGKIINGALDQYNALTQKLTGVASRFIDDEIKMVADDVFEEALNFREGLITTARPQAVKIAAKLDDLFNPFSEVAEKVGITIRNADGVPMPFQPIKNYVPHMIDVAKAKANKDLFINHLIDSQQLAPDAAKEFVERIIANEPIVSVAKDLFPQIGARLHSNLEFGRLLNLPKEVLRRDKGLIEDYVFSASKRFSAVKTFGQHNEKLIQWLDEMKRIDPDAFEIANDAILRELNIMQKENMTSEAVRGITGLQGLIKLGTSAIPNLGQWVNTVTSTGIGNALAALFEAVGNRKLSQKFASDAGIVIDNAIRDVLTDAVQTPGNKLLKFLTAPGFRAVEKFNRVVSTNAGKHLAMDLFQKAVSGDAKAIIKLRELGVNVDEALKVGSMTYNDLLNAGRKVTKMTQFALKPTDMPSLWSEPTVKLMTQFKTFSYSQGGFIFNQVIKKGLEGDLAPLARYIFIGNLVGKGTGTAKRLVTGKKSDAETEMDKLFENVSSIGGAGMPQDLAMAIRYYGRDGFGKWLLGPTFSDIGEGLGAIGSLVKEKPDAKPMGKFAVTKVPVFGQILKNKLYPSGGESKPKKFNSTPIKSSTTNLKPMI